MDGHLKLGCRSVDLCVCNDREWSVVANRASPIVCHLLGLSLCLWSGGHADVLLNATGFPLDPDWPLLVTVRDVACTNLIRHSLDQLSCTVPRGYGPTAPMKLHTPLQTSNSNVTIAYGAPSSMSLPSSSLCLSGAKQCWMLVMVMTMTRLDGQPLCSRF